MDIGVISVRYARALLHCGLESALEDKVYSEMQTMAQSFASVPELQLQAAHAAQDHRALVEIGSNKISNSFSIDSSN